MQHKMIYLFVFVFILKSESFVKNIADLGCLCVMTRVWFQAVSHSVVFADTKL